LKSSALYHKLLQYLGSSSTSSQLLCDARRRATYTKTRAADSSSSCSNGDSTSGAVDRLELRLRSYLKTIVHYSGSPTVSATESRVRQKYDKICSGYRVINEDDYEFRKDDPDDGYHHISDDNLQAIRGNKVSSSNIDVINGSICAFFRKFYMETVLCGLPACVDYFADVGVVSCDVLQLLKMLAVPKVFGECVEISGPKVITNRRSGREKLCVSICSIESTTQTETISAAHDVASADIENIFVGELVDSPTLLDFICQHGRMLELVSRAPSTPS
jgi:hypothetical protein